MSLPQLEGEVLRVIDLLLPYLDMKKASRKADDGPIIVGLTGLQGSGKTTWAKSLVRILNEKHGFTSITVSLDDFYHCHDELVRLRDSDPQNLLLRTRGQPGTHDETLAQDFFLSLTRSESVRIPSFDKSWFNGDGDRTPQSSWPVVSRSPDVVVFEGWCIGFQPLSEGEMTRRWLNAQQEAAQFPANMSDSTTETLALHQREHLLQLNKSLSQYCGSFMGPQHLDMLVHLDTDEIGNVYRWRIQQEEALVGSKGSGMSSTQVVAFVKGYMPSYELYLEGLRNGFFRRDGLGSKNKAQIRVILDVDRRVIDIEKL